MIEGVDYSWARPGGAVLREAGKKFAVRYIPYPGHGGKGLGEAELDDLAHNGISVAMVFESYAHRPLAGFGAGVEDANMSELALNELGLEGLPVYFAVDWDATEGQQPLINQYLLGAASVLGKDRIGIYAGYHVVKRAKEAGVVNYLWQTYAWSGGLVLDGIHLYQYNNGVSLNGDVDLTRALQDNYGQQAAEDMNEVVPTPPPVLPSPTSPGQYLVKPGDTLSAIGHQFGVDYMLIAKANDIANPNLIYPGTWITIPGSGQSEPPRNEMVHIVNPGETLSVIASNYGKTWQELQKYNGIPNADLIYPGQRIKIPA